MLRTKLIVGIVALIVVVCAAIGVATELFLSNYLTRQLDNRLTLTQDAGPRPDRPDTPTDTTGATGAGGTGATVTTGCLTNSNFDNRAQPDGLFVCTYNGSVERATLWKNFTKITLDAATTAQLAGVQPGSAPVTVTVGSYGDYRVAARTTPSPGVVLTTGLSLAEVSATQVQLAVIMAIVAGIAILVGAAVVFVIVRRAVRPLERMASTARKVSRLPLDKGEVDLGVRIPDRDTDTRTEIGQVGAALNQMLANVSGALTARQASETRVRQFVADASHELRTPLAAIRGYAELARRGEYDPAAVTHALRRVESESSRMTTLVEDLLLLARLDSGRPLAREEVDLTVLVVDRVSDARAAGPEHRWQLDLPDEPVTVFGDSARLHQVLANLLANARNHTPPGTLVTTGLREADGGVVMTVTDNGPGIPAELQSEIFGRFVRGDSSRSRAAGSTGLGLAIVAAVIANHGGTVTIDSRPGRTQARVWLPAAPGPDRAAPTPEPATSSSRSPV